MWLVKCLTSVVSEYIATVDMLNSLKNGTTALPSYCLSTLANIELENIRLSLSEILGVFVNNFSADVMSSLCKRKILAHSIQLQSSKKQKMFSQFFAAYRKSTSNVEQFGKKDDPHRLCILNIRDWERWD